MSTESDNNKRAEIGRLKTGDRITVSLTEDSANVLNAEIQALKKAFPAATISASALVNQCLCAPAAEDNKDCAKFDA